VKLCIGGAPVSTQYAKDIGADGYGADAASAVELFQRLIAEQNAGRAADAAAALAAGAEAAPAETPLVQGATAS
jgi:hypothetical protein